MKKYSKTAVIYPIQYTVLVMKVIQFFHFSLIIFQFSQITVFVCYIIWLVYISIKLVHKMCFSNLREKVSYKNDSAHLYFVKTLR